VAARAGLSKAGVYLYFADKMALLKALVVEMAGANLTVARSIIEHHQGPAAPLIRHVLLFMAGQLGTTRFPDLLKIIIAESRAHPEIGRLYLENVIGQGLPLFEGVIRRGIERGEFRAVDPALAVKAMVGPMLLAALWRSTFEPLGAEPLDLEAYASQHVDTFLRGLAP
jgi:AcrR family transcriptional regulator